MNGYLSALLLLVALLAGNSLVRCEGPDSIGLGGKCGDNYYQVCEAFLNCVSKTPNRKGASGTCKPCGRAEGQACCKKFNHVVTGKTLPSYWTIATLLHGEYDVAAPGPSNACQTEKDLGCFSGKCQKMNRCTPSAMVPPGGKCDARKPCQQFNNCVNGRCVPCGADQQTCCELRGSDVCNSEQCQGQDVYDQFCNPKNKCGNCSTC